LDAYLVEADSPIAPSERTLRAAKGRDERSAGVLPGRLVWMSHELGSKGEESGSVGRGGTREDGLRTTR
jgi:hypothetical protein